MREKGETCASPHPRSRVQVVESRFRVHQEVVVRDVPGVGAGHPERDDVPRSHLLDGDLPGEDVLWCTELADAVG